MSHNSAAQLLSNGVFWNSIHFWGERELPVSKEKAFCSLLGGFSGRLVYRADELRFKRSDGKSIVEVTRSVGYEF
jgi:hypothetical protein